MENSSGINDLALETIEHAVCLEDVQFKKVSIKLDCTGSVTVTDKYSIPGGGETCSCRATSDTKTYSLNNGLATGSIDLYYYDKPIKMHIPKIMATHKVREPYNSHTNVDKNIIINSSGTNPKSISNKANQCNYILVNPPAMYMTISGLKKGQSVICILPNKNMTKPTFMPLL